MNGTFEFFAGLLLLGPPKYHLSEKKKTFLGFDRFWTQQADDVK